MKPTIRRALILIPRAMDTENISDAHLANADENQEPVIKRERRATIQRTATKQVDDQQEDGSEAMVEGGGRMRRREETKIGKNGLKSRQLTAEQIPEDNNDQGYIYKCPKCPCRTADFLSLMKHRQKFHSGRGYEGNSIKHLTLNPVLNDPNHYCRACERRFFTANIYTNHLQLVHHIPTVVATATATTTTADDDEIDWNEANLSGNTDNSSNLTCRFCSKGFDSRLALTRHQINDHNKRNNGKRHAAYIEHKRLVHSDKTNHVEDVSTNHKPVTCKLCGMGFTTIKTHLAHFNRVHRDYIKKDASKTDMAEALIQSLPKLRTRRKSKVNKTVRFLLPDTDDTPSPSSPIKDTTTLRCYTCEMDFDTPSDMSRHMRSVHRDKMTPSEPDQDKDRRTAALTTAQHRCRSCLVECESRSALSHHLSTVHNNFDYSSPKKRSVDQPDSSFTPAPKFECSTCSTLCESRSALRRHVRVEHSAEQQQQPREEPLPVDDVDTAMQHDDEKDSYCKVCQKTYKNWRSYRSHLYTKHRDSIAKRTYNTKSSSTNDTSSALRSSSPTTSTVEPLLPDINDPNFYCRVCDKTLETKSNFYSHLLASHSNYAPKDPSLPQQETTTTTTSKKRTAMLDVDDPNHHCAFCDRTFETQDTFHQHLRSEHYIKQRLNNTTANTNTTTTTTAHRSSHASLPSHGKHLCTICQQRQVTLGHHRQHLRLAHKVRLPPVSRDVTLFRYPDEFIDINSPDLYCAKCDHYFSTKLFFMKHVEGVHAMPVEQ
ncbi:C2H2-type zinc finger transcription factor [Mucor lusitanicus]